MPHSVQNRPPSDHYLEETGDERITAELDVESVAESHAHR